MKEYIKLPEELQKAKSSGVLLEEYIFDDGIREDRFYADMKQGKTLVKINSGEYIVSWFLGDEEWNHLYNRDEEEEAYRDFNSIIMEEILDIVDEARENALDILEEIHESDPKAIIEALKPLIYAINQDNENLQSQSIDVLITIAERNINLIKYIAPAVKKKYLTEKNKKVKRKFLYLLGVIGEKYPNLIMDLEDEFIKILDTKEIPILTSLLSVFNKVGKKNIDFVKRALPKIKNLSKDQNITIKTLANNLLKNLNLN